MISLSDESLGAHTFGFVWECSAAEAIKRLAAVGVRRFQLMAMAPHLDLSATDFRQIEKITRAVADCGGEIIAVDLASTECNLASTTSYVVDQAVALYSQALLIADQVGARYLTLNSGRQHMLLPPPDDRLRRIFRDALMRLVEAARARDIGLLIENIPGTLLADARSLRSFLDQDGLEIVRILYDVANAAAIYEDPVDGLSVVADRAAVLHLSDAPAGRWRHDPIGSGAIDIGGILRRAAEVAFDGDLVIEIIGSSALADYVRSRDKVRTLQPL